MALKYWLVKSMGMGLASRIYEGKTVEEISSRYQEMRRLVHLAGLFGVLPALCLILWRVVDLLLPEGPNPDTFVSSVAVIGLIAGSAFFFFFILWMLKRTYIKALKALNNSPEGDA